MLHFLQTHPSVFIIAATFIIIIMIFTCFVKKPDQEYKIEQADNDNNEYVEMEEISSSRPDEPDNGPTLQLTRKVRSNYEKSSNDKYPAIPESPLPQDASVYEALPDVTKPGTSGVVYREPRISNQEKRVSVSDVHRHGSYINFEDEFDSFDEFRNSAAFLRVTMNLGSTENHIYPILDKI